MTEVDFDRIEAALNVQLPAFYRRFMSAYPEWLLTKQPTWSDVANWELPNNSERVIEFNLYVRSFGPDEFVDNQLWPQNYFVIGSEKRQNWYFIDLGGLSQAVSLFHHEAGEIRQAAAEIADFPNTLIKWWADVQRDKDEDRNFGVP